MLSGLLPVVSVPDSMTNAALWMLLLISAAGSLPVVTITTGGAISSQGCILWPHCRPCHWAAWGRIPIILSSALPLILAKAVEKIRSGLFIDFKELLLDNVVFYQRLAETSFLLSGAPPTHLR